jgi:hypothetical protein
MALKPPSIRPRAPIPTTMPAPTSTQPTGDVAEQLRQAIIAAMSSGQPLSDDVLEAIKVWQANLPARTTTPGRLKPLPDGRAPAGDGTVDGHGLGSIPRPGPIGGIPFGDMVAPTETRPWQRTSSMAKWLYGLMGRV